MERDTRLPIDPERDGGLRPWQGGHRAEREQRELRAAQADQGRGQLCLPPSAGQRAQPPELRALAGHDEPAGTGQRDLGQPQRHHRGGVQRAAHLPRRGLRGGLRIGGADRTGLHPQPEELLQEGRGEAGRHGDLLHCRGLCLPAEGRHGAGAQGGLQGGEQLRQHGGHRHTAVPLPETVHAHGNVPQQPERNVRPGNGHRKKVPGIGHVHHTDLKAQRLHQRQLRTQPQGKPDKIEILLNRIIIIYRSKPSIIGRLFFAQYFFENILTRFVLLNLSFGIATDQTMLIDFKM